MFAIPALIPCASPCANVPQPSGCGTAASDVSSSRGRPGIRHCADANASPISYSGAMTQPSVPSICPRRPRTIAMIMVGLWAVVASGCGATSNPSSATVDDVVPVAVATSTSTAVEVEADAPSKAVEDDSPVEEAVAPPAELFAPVDLGSYESSRGRGSLIAEAQKHFFPIAVLDGPWQFTFEPIVDIPECASETAEATVAGAMFLYDDAAQEVGLSNQVTLMVEVHTDAAAAADRAASMIDGDRVACQAAAYEISRAGEESLYRVESAEPGGVLIEPHVDRPGLRTADFDTTAIGPGLTVEQHRTVSTWSIDDMVFLLTVATHDESNVEIATQVVEAIEAQSAPTDVDGVGSLDQSMEKARVAVLQEEVLADFFHVQIPVQVTLPEDDPACNQDYLSPAPLELNGPGWSTRTGTSVLFQGATIFASAADAAQEIQRSTESVGDCLAGLAPTMIPGANETTDSTTGVVTMEGIDVLVATADVRQVIDAPTGRIEADARVMVAVTQVDELVLSWMFIGVAGDEPDLALLVVDAAQQIEAARP